MSVFKEEVETKRVIFNIDIDLAGRLDQAKKNARTIGKKLDADTAVNKALDKFLRKAEKKLQEVMKKKKLVDSLVISSQDEAGRHDAENSCDDLDAPAID